MRLNLALPITAHSRLLLVFVIRFFLNLVLSFIGFTGFTLFLYGLNVIPVLYLNVEDGSLSSAKPFLFLNALLYYKRHFVLLPLPELISWIFYFSINACVLCLAEAFYVWNPTADPFL